MTDALAQLLAARLEHKPIDRLALPPCDESTAYALQKGLHAALGARGYGALVGYKIGCTTDVMQRYLGIPNPCAGGVFERTVQHAAGEFEFRDFVRVGVECELAVILRHDIDPAQAPYDSEAVAAAIDGVMCAIEVVDDRWRNYRAVDTPSLIADDFFNAGCVLGLPLQDWRALNLGRLSASMSVNGERVGSGFGADILGDPLAALAWLANARGACGEGLERGQIVLLGSMVQTRWLAVGDRVAIDVQGLGGAQAQFSA